MRELFTIFSYRTLVVDGTAVLPSSRSTSIRAWASAAEGAGVLETRGEQDLRGVEDVEVRELPETIALLHGGEGLFGADEHAAPEDGGLARGGLQPGGGSFQFGGESPLRRCAFQFRPLHIGGRSRRGRRGFSRLRTGGS